MNDSIEIRDVDQIHDESDHKYQNYFPEESCHYMSQRRLLVICHSYNSFQKDSIEESSRYFHEINVLVRTNPFAEVSNYLPLPRLERFKLSKKIDLTNIPPNIQIFNTPIWYLPLEISYKSLGESHYNAAAKSIRQNHLKFDLIHAHFSWSAGYVGSRLKEAHDVPLIITVHGYDIYGLPFRDEEWRKKIFHILNTADHIITVSKGNQVCIKKLEVTTPVTVIPNGFRGDLFHPLDSSECRKVLGLPLDKKIILTAGNLETVKGQKYLIDAVKAITSQRKDVLFVIVGSGSLHNALKRQINILGLNKYIVLVGGKPHNEIPLWMNACDLFVLPSLNEGNPTVMFETLGCGKPFIGTSVGAVPQVITSDEYGLIVKPGDSVDLEKKILNSLDRLWNREKILSYAQRYTWKNISKEIINVYDSVLNG